MDTAVKDNETGVAIERAYKGFSDEEKDTAYSIVAWLAYNRPSFTADSLVDLFEERYGPVSDRRRFGGVMVRAKKAGLIEKACMETLPYPRRGSHARPRNIWRSLVYTPL